MADPVRDARTRNVRELRRDSTVGEVALWECLRDRRLDGWKFRRQRPIGQFVADFCCDGLKLIVEVDGAVHDEVAQAVQDERRDATLRDQGYVILRVPDSLVQDDLNAALALISSHARGLAAAEGGQP